MLLCSLASFSIQAFLLLLCKHRLPWIGLDDSELAGLEYTPQHENNTAVSQNASICLSTARACPCSHGP